MRTSAIAIAAATLASAASAQDIVQAQNEWFVAGQGTIEEMLALQPNTNTAVVSRKWWKSEGGVISG